MSSPVLDYLNKPLKISPNRPSTPEYAQYLQRRYLLRSIPNLPTLSPPPKKAASKQSLERKRREQRRERALQKFHSKGEMLVKQRKAERRKLEALKWQGTLSPNQLVVAGLSPKSKRINENTSSTRSPAKKRGAAFFNAAHDSPKGGGSSPQPAAKRKTVKQRRQEMQENEKAKKQEAQRRQQRKRKLLAERAYQRRMQVEENFAARMKKMEKSESEPVVRHRRRARNGANESTVELPTGKGSAMDSVRGRYRRLQQQTAAVPILRLDSILPDWMDEIHLLKIDVRALF